MLSGAGVIQAASGGSEEKVHTTIDVYLDTALSSSSNDGFKGTFTTAALDNAVIVTGNTDYPVYATVLNAESGAPEEFVGQVTATETPGVGVSISYDNVSTYTITRKWATPADAVKQTLRIDCYVARSQATRLSIDAETFAGYYYIEASTLFREESTGADFPAEFTIPKGKIQSNFTFNLAATGDPSTFTFTIDAFPAFTKNNKTKRVLAEIQIVTGAESLG